MYFFLGTLSFWNVPILFHIYLDTGFIVYHLYFMDLQAMGANVKMAETMGATSKVMANMNKMMNPQQVKVKVVESGGDKKYVIEFLA